MFNVPFGVSSGAAFGVTAPDITALAAGRPGAVAFALMATWDDVWRGVQVAEYRPVLMLASESGSGGSPFENVATIWPLITGLAQSFSNCMEIGVGHAAGAAKSPSRPVCAVTSCLGVQPPSRETSCGVIAEGVTMSVTLTVRTAAPANA